MKNSDEGVLAAAVQVIGAAQRMLPWYAGDFAPIRSDQLAELLRRATCDVAVYPFGSDTVAMAMPPHRGRYPVFVNRRASREARSFALRHELGHVLAGDVEEAIFLAPEGYMAPQERVADTFALAGLVPGWFLRSLRREGMSWMRVGAEIRDLIAAAHGSHWRAERVEDRAALRLELFRRRGD